MDARLGTGRINNRINIAYSYKEMEAVESHGLPHPEWIQYIKEDYKRSLAVMEMTMSLSLSILPCFFQSKNFGQFL